MERTPSSSAEDQAASLINAVVTQQGGSRSNTEIARGIESIAREYGVEQETASYVQTLREQSHTFVVDALPPGVGGQFDGSAIEVAESTMTVDQSVQATVDRLQEVTAHEAYHAMHSHTDAMMTYQGEPTVVIAGQEFDSTALIEGLTVADTGNTFVSEQYQEYEERLRSAAQAAGIGLEGVRSAVNDEKDLTAIDDRSRVPEQLALAA